MSRLAAFLVDASAVVTLGCLGAGAAELVGVVVAGAGARDLAHQLGRLSLLALPAVMALYNGLCYGAAARTPGMALLGLRLTGRRGGRVGWTSAAVRAVALAFFPVGSVWCLVDRRHRALHDLLARTTVVYAGRCRTGVTTMDGGRSP